MKDEAKIVSYQYFRFIRDVLSLVRRVKSDRGLSSSLSDLLDRIEYVLTKYIDNFSFCVHCGHPLPVLPCKNLAEEMERDFWRYVRAYEITRGITFEWPLEPEVRKDAHVSSADGKSQMSSGGDTLVESSSSPPKEGPSEEENLPFDPRLAKLAKSKKVPTFVGTLFGTPKVSGR